MSIHKNARLTPQGRLLIVQRIEEEGWRVADTAAAAGLSVRRAFEWLRRYRAGGESALQDCRSTLGRYRPRQPSARDRQIEELRRQRRTGERIARRLGLGRLRALDAPAPVIRYQRERPSELLHIDTKKLGRIDGIGHRITGHRAGLTAPSAGRAMRTARKRVDIGHQRRSVRDACL